MTLKKFLEHWELDQGSIQVVVQGIHFQIPHEFRRFDGKTDLRLYIKTFNFASCQTGSQLFFYFLSSKHKHVGALSE